MNKKQSPLVSVIVPVWNDAANLRRCLEGMRAQSYPPDRIQTIVVDNGSTDGSRELAESFPEVTVLHEPMPGSYAARNVGLMQAQGAYVAFLDSDCEPDHYWIARAEAAASTLTNLGILAGRIEIACDDASSRRSAVLYERLFSFDQQRNARQGTCATANWFSPKVILDRFGGFDATMKSGADTKLSRAINNGGHKVIYRENVVVRHAPRATLKELAAKRRRIIGGKWQSARPGVQMPLWLAATITWDGVLRALRTLQVQDLRLIERIRVVGIIAVIWGVGLAELVRLGIGYEPRRR